MGKKQKDLDYYRRNKPGVTLATALCYITLLTIAIFVLRPVYLQFAAWMRTNYNITAFIQKYFIDWVMGLVVFVTLVGAPIYWLVDLWRRDWRGYRLAWEPDGSRAKWQLVKKGENLPGFGLLVSTQRGPAGHDVSRVLGPRHEIRSSNGFLVRRFRLAVLDVDRVRLSDHEGRTLEGHPEYILHFLSTDKDTLREAFEHAAEYKAHKQQIEQLGHSEAIHAYLLRRALRGLVAARSSAVYKRGPKCSDLMNELRAQIEGALITTWHASLLADPVAASAEEEVLAVLKPAGLVPADEHDLKLAREMVIEDARRQREREGGQQVHTTEIITSER